MSVSGKRVVITGGAGFIGSHLSKIILEREGAVICIDNLITGSLSNIEHLFGQEGFQFIKQDVTNYVHIPGDIHYVLHFASPASPVDYLQYPIQTLKVGALGTHKALGLAKAKHAVFLLASTSEVYGDPQVPVQPETYWGHVNPIGPRGVYDEAKRFAEAITMAYQRFHGLSTRIVRIFNTYGPRMRPDDGRVVPTFIHQALKGENLTVFGEGKQTRSFCYITDLVRGILKLMESDVLEPVNIGNPHEMTVLELGTLIRELIPSSGEIVYRPLPTDDPRVRRPDISRARTLLRWEPEVPLREGLQNTIEYFRSLQTS